MSDATKTFVTKIQVGFRIQITDPYVVVLGLKEGDLVEISIKKVEPAKETESDKQEDNAKP